MGVLSNIFKARDKPENRTLHGRHNFLQGSNRAFCHADDGVKEKAIDHPLYRLLHDEPKEKEQIKGNLMEQENGMLQFHKHRINKFSKGDRNKTD